MLPRTTSAFVSVALLAVAVPAWAGPAVDGQVSGAASLGITSNVANTVTPDEGSDAPGPDADGFGTVSPGGRLILEDGSVTQVFSYAFVYQFFFTHPEANTYGNSLAYGLRSQVSPTTEFIFGLAGSQTSVAFFNLSTAPVVTSTSVTGGGDDLLFTGAIDESTTTAVGESVSFTQALGGRWTQSATQDADDSRSAIGTFTTSLRKSFEFDTIGGVLGTDAQYALPIGEEPDGEPARLEMLHRAELTWSHVLSPDWSFDLGAGIILGYSALAELVQPVLQPTGHGAITFSNERGTVALSVDHTGQPNLLLNSATLNDSFALRAAVPFGNSGFDLNGALGGTITRSFLSDGLGPPGYGLLADAALGWVPGESAFRVEARYQWIRQFASEVDSTGGIVVPNLERHTGLVTFTVAWPGSPTAGGAGSFVALPPPTANPDILSQSVAPTDRTNYEEEKDAKDKAKEDRESRGGSGSSSESP